MVFARRVGDENVTQELLYPPDKEEVAKGWWQLSLFVA